jgi:hypothetical protein
MVETRLLVLVVLTFCATILSTTKPLTGELSGNQLA